MANAPEKLQIITRGRQVFIARQQGSVKRWTGYEGLHNLFFLSFRFNMIPTAYRAISTSSNKMYFENGGQQRQ